METYGVSFEGFEPSCGWPFYKHIRDEFLPKLKAEVERWRKLCDTFVNEGTLLKQFNADCETLAKCHEGMMVRLRTAFSEGMGLSETSTLDEIMPLGVQEAKQDGAEVETKRTWTELSSWLKEANSFVKEMSIYNAYARERADCALGMFQTCVESTEADIRFWEHTLGLQKSYWVFEKAELKYKTKICREIVKSLSDYIGDCREQMGRYDEEKRASDPLFEDIKWLFDESQKDIVYYRQLKADIATVGVKKALKHSSRKVTQPVANPDVLDAIDRASSD